MPSAVEDPQPPPPKRRRLAILVTLGLLVLAGAGGGVFYFINQLDNAAVVSAPPIDPKELAARSRRQSAAWIESPHYGPDAPQDRSPLTISRAGGRATVAVGRSRLATPEQKHLTSMVLGREIFRQALLLSAREEAGAAILDESLGEAPPAPDATTRRFELHHALARDHTFRISIREPGDEGAILWADNFSLPSLTVYLMGRIVERLEPLTRTTLVDALAARGVEAPPKPTNAAPQPDGGAIDPGTARLLDTLTFPAQFAALRQLHQAAKPGEQTPAQVDAIARAYANLAVLTEYHWSPAHHAFAARALLYGQRAVALWPERPESFWTRFYTRALLGLHQEAETDFEMARTMVKAQAKGRKSPLPRWLAPVAALCRFDMERLARFAAEPEQRPMATMFALMAVESSHAFRQAIGLANAAQEANPGNLWVNDASCRIPPIGHLHVATLDGAARFARYLIPEVRALPGLPEPVARAIEAGSAEAEVINAIIAAGAPGRDAVEPSWSVLGQMIRDARFTQLANRVEFMAAKWSVPVDEFVEQVRPIGQDHPCWPVLEALAANPGFDVIPIARRLQALSTDNLDLAASLMDRAFTRFAPAVPGGRQHVLGALNNQMSSTERAWAMKQRFSPRLPKAQLSTIGVSMSPESPVSMATWIADDPEAALQAQPEVETRHAQHPDVLLALGKYRLGQKRYDDAERILQAAIKLSPEAEMYSTLAEAYLRRGQADRWRATLLDFLKVSDPGLDHAQVQVKLARDHMRRGEFEQALPFAEEAAVTYAGWALKCAAECHELMGHDDLAERRYRQLSERYESSCVDWYLFCVRSNRTTEADAAALVQAIADRLGDASPPLPVQETMTYFILTGQADRALTIASRAFERMPYAAGEVNRHFLGWGVVALADELGVAELRDRVLGELASRYASDAPRMSRIAGLLRDEFARARAGGQPEAIDLAPMEAVYAAMPDDGRASLGYFVGRFQERHGHPAEAAKSYRDATRLGKAHPTSILAVAAAKKLASK